MEANNQKKNVVLYLNSNLYERYASYCEKEGLTLSRQIEKFIEEQLEKNDNK